MNFTFQVKHKNTLENPSYLAPGEFAYSTLLKQLWIGNEDGTQTPIAMGWWTYGWNEIQNKPEYFPPTEHIHSIDDISDVPDWIKHPSLDPEDIPEIPAEKITSGMLSKDVLPPLTFWDIGGYLADYQLPAAISPSRILGGQLSIDVIPDLPASKIIGVITDDDITNLQLDASAIISGTLNINRIPFLSANKINSGVFHIDRIPDIPVEKIIGAPTELPYLSSDGGTVKGNFNLYTPDIETNHKLRIGNQDLNYGFEIRYDANADTLELWADNNTGPDVQVFKVIQSGVLDFNIEPTINGSTVIKDSDPRLSNSRKCDNTFDNAIIARSNIGLGNVQNYAIATQSEAEEGTSNTKYMTPVRVKQSIISSINNTPQSGASDRSISSSWAYMHTVIQNPHNITKNTLGLNNVSNYTIASKEEAEAGELNVRYMTPLRVKEAVAAQSLKYTFLGSRSGIGNINVSGFTSYKYILIVATLDPRTTSEGQLNRVTNVSTLLTPDDFKYEQRQSAPMIDPDIYYTHSEGATLMVTSYYTPTIHTMWIFADNSSKTSLWVTWDKTTNNPSVKVYGIK